MITVLSFIRFIFYIHFIAVINKKERHENMAVKDIERVACAEMSGIGLIKEIIRISL